MRAFVGLGGGGRGPQAVRGDGLSDRLAPGAAPKLTVEQKAALAAIVEAGPNPEADGVVRWRRIDLKAVIEDRFGVVYHERSVSRLLHALDFAHLSARPRHPAQDGDILDAFKKTSRAPWPRR